jgi:hypothetical protein
MVQELELSLAERSISLAGLASPNDRGWGGSIGCIE